MLFTYNKHSIQSMEYKLLKIYAICRHLRKIPNRYMKFLELLKDIVKKKKETNILNFEILRFKKCFILVQNILNFEILQHV